MIVQNQSQTNTPAERVPLTGREYYALRALMGIVSTFETEDVSLEKRLKSIRGGWRDIKLIEKLSSKLLDLILTTVPQKKLEQIRLEISHTRVEISVVRDVAGRYKPNFTYVPNEALEWLEEQVIDMNCMLCDKTDKESKRCPIRRNIEALYMYDFPERKGCPIAQLNIE